jgi:hypothetical protein
VTFIPEVESLVLTSQVLDTIHRDVNVLNFWAYIFRIEKIILRKNGTGTFHNMGFQNMVFITYLFVTFFKNIILITWLFKTRFSKHVNS